LPSQNKWDRHFLRLAWLTAINLSKDPKTQVGAVIVAPGNRQISVEYNGMPAGLEETEEKWQRPTKYPYLIHAELNAVINCPFDTRGCTIYITHKPCHACMGHLRNAGIKRIVYNEIYKKATHKEIIETN